jgi:alpha-beta hydrolase superfamily lysophospholipase
MRSEFFFESKGKGIIHAVRWTPDCEVKGVVQILHGIAEYALRYDSFANYLNSIGYAVVAEDHMGHGKSGGEGCARGYFHGGWKTACEDSLQLMTLTKEEYPDMPYFLFGHSMGSFMTRTILIDHPELDIAGAVICGTGWMSELIIGAGCGLSKLICKGNDEKLPNEMLQKVAFGTYNNKVEHPKTAYDWLNRDANEVQKYVDDPDCGFTASAGLLRDMMGGIRYNQKKENLQKMNTKLPVYFIAGGADPVGDYGAGVRKAAEQFKANGMEKVDCKIYPLCRHEILNEINKDEVFNDVSKWLSNI